MARVERRAHPSGKTTYRVRFSKEGKRVNRSFDSLVEAEAFADTIEAVDANAGVVAALHEKMEVSIEERVKAEVERRLNERLGAEVEGKVSIDEAISRFIQSRVMGVGDADPCTPETVIGYKRWLSHTATFFAGRKVETITRKDARDFQAFVDTIPLSVRTRSGIYGITSTMWKFLRAHDIVQTNPFDEVVDGAKPKTKRRNKATADMQKQAFTYDEMFALWKLAERMRFGKLYPEEKRATCWRHSVMLKVLIATGLRRSELCGLKMDAYDRHKGTLAIMTTVAWNGREGAVKTHNSTRVLYLHPEVRRALDQWLDDRKKLVRVDSDYIFAHDDGLPIPGNTWSQNFERLRVRAGVRPLGMHSLRHSMTSILVDTKVDAVRVINTMGHDTIGFSMKQYGHVMKHDGDQAAREFIQEVCVFSTGLSLEKIKVLAA